MNRWIPWLCVLAAASGGALSAAPELRTIDGVTALAAVNGEPVSVDEYLRALGELHAEAREGGAPVARKDPMELLDRLIGSKLILQEARSIGLHETEDVRKAVEQYREDLLRESLFDRLTRGLPPPDPAKVEKEFRALVEEVELASVMFRSKESADAFIEVVLGGTEFSEAVAEAKAEGTAISTEGPTYLKRSELLPEVAAVLEGLEPGGVSAPAPTPKGIAVVRYLGSRYPADPEARAAAEGKVAAAQANDVLRKDTEELRARTVHTDQQLAESLDFDAEVEEFEKFLEDDRVLVRFEGGSAPIRVRDLATALKNRQFHGVERAAEKGRLGKMKFRVLDNMTLERMLHDEAIRLGLDQDPAFVTEVQEFENSLVFAAFVRKAIDSSIDVTRDDVLRYHERHRQDYTSPEMVRLEALTFSDAASAQRALERLHAGADLTWMGEHAEGQVDRATLPPEARYEGRVLMTSALPEGLAQAIAGANPGTYRIWEQGPERHDVVVVRERIPSSVQPIDEVQGDVVRNVFNEKRAAALRDWEAKLRAASAIEVFVDEDQLRQILGQGMGSAAPK